MTARAMEAGAGRRDCINIKLLFRRAIYETDLDGWEFEDFDDRVNGDVLRLSVYGEFLRLARIS
jgi:hypothetical protein